MPLDEKEQHMNRVATIAASLISSGKADSAEHAILLATDALAGAELPVSPKPNRNELLPADPIVPVAESVFDDGIICLACGQKQRVLTRHVQSTHEVSIDAYFAHFRLPASYPKTCSQTSGIKSDQAKARNFGMKQAAE